MQGRWRVQGCCREGVGFAVTAVSEASWPYVPTTYTMSFIVVMPVANPHHQPESTNLTSWIHLDSQVVVCRGKVSVFKVEF